MPIYMNDNEPTACEWLRELQAAGLIPEGTVDERSISEVQPTDLVGFRRCGFFGGIAGWEEALRIAGWPDSQEIWHGSCPCFPAGTLVLTDHGYKAIELVRMGDMVLTHRGRFRPVVQVGSEMAECVTVKGQGHFGLTCTPDHPFLVGEEEWADAQDLRGRRWANVAHVPTLPMPELECPRTGCFFDTVLGKYRARGEKDGRPVYLGVFDSLSEAVAARKQAVRNGRVSVRGADGVDISSLGFARFLGYWIGDGWVSGGMVLLCGSMDDCELLNELFAAAGLPGKAYLERTTSRIRCGSKHLVQWLKENFSEKADGKRIPTWLHGMAKEYRDAFLEGYLMADGSTEEQSCGKGRLKSFTTVSRALAIGVRVLFNQSRMSASIRKQVRGRQAVIEGRSVNEKTSYQVVVYESARSFRFSGQHGWGYVRSVTAAGQHRVYNVAVAEDESYTADGIVVHNCPPFSSAGKKKKCPGCGGGSVVPCPRRTGHFICVACEHGWHADGRHLWPEFWRLIAGCRPPVVVGEQVAGKDAELWYAGVRLSLAAIGYRCGAANLCAAGAGQTAWEIVWHDDGSVTEDTITLGAPHIRQRIFWVAVRADVWERTRGVGHAAGMADPGHRVGGRAGVIHTGAGDPAERDEMPTDAERRGGTVGSGVGLADAGRGRVRGVGRQLGGAAGGVGGEVREQRVRDDAGDGGHARGVFHPASDGRGERRAEPVGRGTAGGCSNGGVANADGRQSGDGELQRGGEHGQQPQDGGVGGVGHTDGPRPGTRQPAATTAGHGSAALADGGTDARADGVALGDPVGTRLEVPAVEELCGTGRRQEGREPGQSGGNFWSAYDVIHCRDNKWRRIPKGSAESVFFGLAHGLQHGVGGGGVAGGGHGEKSFPLSFEKVEGRAAVLKGLGNAVVPAIAAEFVSAVMEVLGIIPEYT